MSPAIGGIYLLFLYNIKAYAVVPSDNNITYKVDILFEHDGCKVYRFMTKVIMCILQTVTVKRSLSKTIVRRQELRTLLK
jgi:hypothetical protein